MKTKLCSCQRYCHAPPQGKPIPQRTWYKHAAQRALEAEMTIQERESQQVQRKRRRRRPQGDELDGASGSSSEQRQNVVSTLYYMTTSSSHLCRNKLLIIPRLLSMKFRNMTTSISAHHHHLSTPMKRSIVLQKMRRVHWEMKRVTPLRTYLLQHSMILQMPNGWLHRYESPRLMQKRSSGLKKNSIRFLIPLVSNSIWMTLSFDSLFKSTLPCQPIPLRQPTRLFA